MIDRTQVGAGLNFLTVPTRRDLLWINWYRLDAACAGQAWRSGSRSSPTAFAPCSKFDDDSPIHFAGFEVGKDAVNILQWPLMNMSLHLSFAGKFDGFGQVFTRTHD